MSKRLKTTIIIAIVFLLVILALSYYFLFRNKNQNGKTTLFGVGTRFSTSKKPKESDPGARFSYSLSPEQSFEGYYEIHNVRDEKHTYLLLTFLDFKQVPVFLGNNLADSHSLTLKPNQKKWWNFKTEPLKTGRHDFFTILIWDPDKHSLSKDYRFSTESGHISDNRASIRVENKDFPKLSIDKPLDSRPMAEEGAFQGLRINKKSRNEEDLWFKQATKPDKKTKYYIHVGNLSNKDLTFGLVALLDFKQIPIKTGGNTVSFLRIEPGEVQTIPAEFIAPKKKGTHELLVLSVPKPYGSFKDDDDDVTVLPSMRVPIIVK